MGRKEHLNKAVSILEDLVGQYPDVPVYRHLLACCYREMPPDRPGRGRAPDSESLDKATEILEQLVDDFPEVADYRYDLSKSYAMVQVYGPFRDRRAVEAAEPRVRKALGLSEALLAEHPNVPDFAASNVHILLKLAEVLRATGKSDDAEAALRKAFTVQSSLAKRFPEASSYRVWNAIVQEILAGLLAERGKLEEARSLLEASIGTLEGLLSPGPGPRHVRGLIVMNQLRLADVLDRMDQKQAAESARRRAEELRREM